MASPRPRFEPTQYNATDEFPPPLCCQMSTWLPLVSCPASFPFDLFEIAGTQLIDHPEYNSTLILRSETLAEIVSDFPAQIPVLDSKIILRAVYRRLLPRRPGRDNSLEQYCSVYNSQDSDIYPQPHIPDTLVLTPIIPDGSTLPYYHPAVSHLAVRFLHTEPPSLRIEVVPLSGTSTDPNSRLYRTCLALLDTLDRYGWGALTHYKKRVIHDSIVPREPYQDLYLIMRKRHKHLVNIWQEVTDPLKHVFEDIGIATYLMLLWRDTFSESTKFLQPSDIDQPWKSWPRPPAGFIDLGCGNGLLAHILLQEGYEGCGIDLRARTSWSYYPQSTQDHLHVHALDPTSSVVSDAFFKPGVFIIGNHADELTPWVPVLSTHYEASGYLNIPCCPWSFDVKYERSTTPMFSNPEPDFAASLNLGGGGKGSSYSMYRIWLASLSLHCGWQVECETLRIPSTRNWALVGRHPHNSKILDAKQNVAGIIQNVVERGIFKARKPEGKQKSH